MPSAASEAIMNIRILCALAPLLAITGCGSSSTAPPSAPTAISYVNPVGDGWKLVSDKSSTATRIVLNLVGPGGLTVRGVGFNLQKGSSLAFGQFDGGAYAHDTGVFELTGSNTNFESYAGTAADPVLFGSGIMAAGTVLTTGIFQKDRTRVPKPLDKPVVQVAIELAPNAPVVAGDDASLNQAYGLKVIKARIIPADIGGMDFILTTTVIAKAHMQDVYIAVGSIIAK
jgi:hypothetical protein